MVDDRPSESKRDVEPNQVNASKFVEYINGANKAVENKTADFTSTFTSFQIPPMPQFFKQDIDNARQGVDKLVKQGSESVKQGVDSLKPVAESLKPGLDVVKQDAASLTRQGAETLKQDAITLKPGADTFKQDAANLAKQSVDALVKPGVDGMKLDMSHFKSSLDSASSSDLQKLAFQTYIENPLKVLGAGAALWKMGDHYTMSNVALAAAAGLQTYEDFQALRQQRTLTGAGLYAAGLVTDVALGAGSLGLLAENYVSGQYAAPLMAVGLLGRAEVGHIIRSLRK